MSSRERLDERYRKYVADHPGVSYAEWMNIVQVESLSRGGEHATLGPNLRKYPNWWDAGANAFYRYQRTFPILRRSRVVDYGCGSLRVGGHFIRYLDPGHYFGLDVGMGFIDMGKALVGDALLAQKTPRFASIDEDSMREAVAFDADIVCSNAVSYHVHPDEAPLYFANLARLAHKPGATLFFDVSVSDEPIDKLQLSMPVDYFRQALPRLDFAMFHEIDKRPENNQIVGIMEFKVPA
jgi:SAM-dependent methyltransferase